MENNENRQNEELQFSNQDHTLDVLKDLLLTGIWKTEKMKL